MMKKMNKKLLCLAMAAFVLTAAVSVKNAMAYFTTYVVASGEESLNLGFAKTELEETINGTDKAVTVANTVDASCYVRVRILTISDEKITDLVKVSEPDFADNWKEISEGYYEYKSVLGSKSETSVLNVMVTPTSETEDFDVIVIQETAPVLYDENGNTYAGWNSSDYILEKR